METTQSLVLSLDGIGEEIEYERSLDLALYLGCRVYAIKVHVGAIMRYPYLPRILKDLGALRVWLDFKGHDIESVVARNIRDARRCGIDIATIHACGGLEMMKAAVWAAQEFPGFQIYAVTVLTSLGANAVFKETGKRVRELVLERALLASEAHVHGIVCSAHEARMLSRRPELSSINLVTPGIRLDGSPHHDQKRVATPAQALQWGADIIVVGRPLTENPDFTTSYQQIAAQLAATKEEVKK